MHPRLIRIKKISWYDFYISTHLGLLKKQLQFQRRIAMMILSTKPFMTDNPQVVNVLWCTGSVKRGGLRIHLPRHYNEPSLVAELCALRHLIFTVQPFNVFTIDGKGIELHTSSGAIKKLALRRSTKAEAMPYSRFLRTRLSALTYGVLGKSDPIPSMDDPDLEWEDLIITEEQFQAPYEPIVCGNLGALAITDHAIERYRQRVESGEPKSPIRSLLRRLSNPRLQKLHLSEKVLKHKNRKYGSNNDIEVWGHESSEIAFLVLNKPEQKILLTTFIRETSKLPTVQEIIRQERKQKPLTLQQI